jgi:hypothetical protein
MRLLAADTARAAMGCCGFVATVRRGTRDDGPSCDKSFTTVFGFEGAAAFPVAFSFSAGKGSIYGDRFDSVKRLE